MSIRMSSLQTKSVILYDLIFMSDIEKRKDEHLDVVLRGEAAATANISGFDDIRFSHCALPELSIDAIDMSTRFFDKTLAAPLLISSMTGGPQRSIALNRHIAEACNTLGLAFGVGSQRIALEGGSAAGFGRDLRRFAPNAAILANFGAAQLQHWNGAEMARRAVEMIEADALIIHLNPLQEAVQSGGDTDWTGLLEKIETVCRESSFPVICKEVGAGLSRTVARRLVDVGVAAIDVAGVGGTSWVAVEAARADLTTQREIASPFRDWGIPTAQAVAEVRHACPNTCIIASGGVRDGLDCARSIRLGADVAGIAAGVLSSAIDGTEALISRLEIIIAQLRIACFCTGSGNLAQLRTASLVNPPSYVH